MSGKRIPNNTSGLKFPSDPPVTTTCWFKRAALRKLSLLGKLFSTTFYTEQTPKAARGFDCDHDLKVPPGKVVSLDPFVV